MDIRHRWERRDARLSFDIEWTFHRTDGSMLTELTTAVTRVTLSDDKRSLRVLKLDQGLSPGQQRPKSDSGEAAYSLGSPKDVKISAPLPRALLWEFQGNLAPYGELIH
jgi:hypothetical protein